VISNGTDSRYFANTTKRDKNSFDFTIPVFALIGTVNFPQNPLSRGNLIGAHHQQSTAYIKYRIAQEHIQQGIFLEKCRRKIF
jgi:hypothetical protein